MEMQFLIHNYNLSRSFFGVKNCNSLSFTLRVTGIIIDAEAENRKTKEVENSTRVSKTEIITEINIIMLQTYRINKPP